MGISVGRETVRAVLVRERSIQWAGAASYSDVDDLAEVLARLAAQGNGVARPRRVAVVLERAMVQLRTVLPAPPLRGSAANHWVALEATRLFRKNGAPLVTDARCIQHEGKSRALLAAAAPEPLVEAILSGCAAAGLVVERLGAGAEALPFALEGFRPPGSVALPNCSGTETIDVAAAGTWRSRWTRDGAQAVQPEWVGALRELGAEAPTFAAAYGATIMPAGLALVPEQVRRDRQHHSTRRAARIALIGLGLWLAAAGLHVVRLSSTVSSSTHFLDAEQSSIDSVLTLRRDLRMAQQATDFMAAAERHRSSHLALLSELTAALPDSMHVVALRVTNDGIVRLSGHAPVAARALVAVQRVPRLRDARFEGPVDRDRFAIVAHLAGKP